MEENQNRPGTLTPTTTTAPVRRGINKNAPAVRNHPGAGLAPLPEGITAAGLAWAIYLIPPAPSIGAETRVCECTS